MKSPQQKDGTSGEKEGMSASIRLEKKKKKKTSFDMGGGFPLKLM